MTEVLLTTKMHTVSSD